MSHRINEIIHCYLGLLKPLLGQLGLDPTRINIEIEKFDAFLLNKHVDFVFHHLLKWILVVVFYVFKCILPVLRLGSGVQVLRSEIISILICDRFRKKSCDLL